MVCNCLRHQVQQREQATKAAVDSQEEAQILPLMAQAAAKGGGVEYDKYEAMLDQMATIKFAKDECVFRQGDAATSVYLVTNGQLEVVIHCHLIMWGTCAVRVDPVAHDPCLREAGVEDVPFSCLRA